MSEGSEENCPAPKVSDVIITDAQEREMHSVGTYAYEKLHVLQHLLQT